MNVWLCDCCHTRNLKSSHNCVACGRSQSQSQSQHNFKAVLCCNYQTPLTIKKKLLFLCCMRFSVKTKNFQTFPFFFEETQNMHANSHKKKEDWFCNGCKKYIDSSLNQCKTCNLGKEGDFIWEMRPKDANKVRLNKNKSHKIESLAIDGTFTLKMCNGFKHSLKKVTKQLGQLSACLQRKKN